MERLESDVWVGQRGAALLRFDSLVTRDHGRAEEAVQEAVRLRIHRALASLRDNLSTAGEVNR